MFSFYNFFLDFRVIQFYYFKLDIMFYASFKFLNSFTVLSTLFPYIFSVGFIASSCACFL